MDNLQSPPQPAQLIFIPLMISMVCIFSVALALLVYYFIVTKYCITRPELISQRIPSHKVVTGVDDAVLKSIPILAYSRKQTELFHVDQSECAVCLGELEEEEIVRLLPSCRHAFHVQCIDEWFVSHSNCPVCRSPLVEVVCLELPTQVGVEEENYVHLVPQFHDHGVGDSNDPSPRIKSNCLLRHASLVLSSDRKPPMLNRSLSMDHSYISLRIQRDQIKDSSSPSSLSSSVSKEFFVRRGTKKLGSFRCLDHASSRIMKSFSQLRIGHSGEADETLPR